MKPIPGHVLQVVEVSRGGGLWRYGFVVLNEAARKYRSMDFLSTRLDERRKAVVFTKMVCDLTDVINRGGTVGKSKLTQGKDGFYRIES
jgi:hypothetical protein